MEEPKRVRVLVPMTRKAKNCIAYKAVTCCEERAFVSFFKITADSPTIGFARDMLFGGNIIICGYTIVIGSA